MHAGLLDTLITIEGATKTEDPIYGTELVTWGPVTNGRVWANFEDTPPSKAEAVRQGLTVARNQSRVTILFRADLNSAMRVVRHDGTADVIFAIVGGPATIGRKEWTEFVVERYSS
jgi:head-tail adaptor